MFTKAIKKRLVMGAQALLRNSITAIFCRLELAIGDTQTEFGFQYNEDDEITEQQKEGSIN